MNHATSVQPGFRQGKQIAVLTVFAVALSLLAATAAQAVEMAGISRVSSDVSVIVVWLWAQLMRR